MNNIQLAHGSGGQAMQQLINSLFMEAFANPWLAEQEDQARLDLAQLVAEGDRLAFSTDSYVIDPLFFPGGNIGKLAICGTANDVAVSGAIPRYLSCGFILEEGLPMETLKAVVTSMAETARAAGIAIVTGDTKVVQRGAADKLFINTAGMGAIPANIHWGAQTLTAGDVLLVSGTLGDHGATILNLREQLGLDGELVSDCAVLAPLIQTLRDIPGVKALRDATRGGVNAVVHEFAAACGCGIELSEAALPVKPAVRVWCLNIVALSKVTEIVASNPGDIEKRVAFFHGVCTAAITAFRNVPILTVVDDSSVFHLYRLLSYWLHRLDLRLLSSLNLWLLYRLNLRLLRCRRRPHFRRRRNQHTRIGICGRIAINGADRCRWI